MSISPTVGAMPVTGPYPFDHRYRVSKRKVSAINRMPLGKQVWSMGLQIEKLAERCLPSDAVLGKFGFSYIGPVDGMISRSWRLPLTGAQLHR